MKGHKNFKKFFKVCKICFRVRIQYFKEQKVKYAGSLNGAG